MVKRVGNYILESRLGEGNYGVVYIGKQVESNQAIAVKVIPVKNLNEKLYKQIELEIKALRKADSPYVVKLYDVLRTQNNIYLMMEYCGGGDLEKYVKDFQKVKESLAKKWISQIIEAFINLQSNNIMHRDLKLANILLTTKSDDASIRVADFGFAKILQNDLATTQLGTPIFMAPEIFNDEHYSYKADVWSLGVLSYEILTGISAFNCRSIAQLQRMQREEVKFPANCELSQEVKDFIKIMLTYDHERRPSFQQLKEMPYIQSLYPPKIEVPLPRLPPAPLHEEDKKEEDITIEEYEILREISEDEFEPDQLEDEENKANGEEDKPEVKIEPNYWELATKTRDLDCILNETEGFIALQNQYKDTNENIAKEIEKYCKKRYESLLEESKKMIRVYNLTDSDYFFNEIYGKINTNLKEINKNRISGRNPKNSNALYEEAKGIMDNEPSHNQVKQALLLLTVALDLDPNNNLIQQCYNDALSDYQKASLHPISKYK